MELKDILRKFIAQNLPDSPFVRGTVKSVSGLECEIEPGADFPAYTNVMLRASLADPATGVILTPKVGSNVFCCVVDQSAGQAHIFQYDQVEKVEILTTAGAVGTVPFSAKVADKILALENKVNKLIQDMGTHTHTGNLGAPTTPPIPPFVADAVITPTTTAADLENANFKHS